MTPEERLAVLETEMRDVRDDLKKSNAKLDSVITTLAEFKGGRKALFGLLAASSGAGALLMAFVTYIWPRN